LNSFQGEETLNETITEVTEKWCVSCPNFQDHLQLMPTSPESNSSTGHHASSAEPTVETDLSLGLAPFSATKHYSGTNDDSDSHIKISEELFLEVNWQPEAALSIASAVCGVKSGSCKGYRLDKSARWLLLKGPDHIGKRKMAHALSMLLFSEKPATFNLDPKTESTSREQGIIDHGKTQLDLVVEAVKSNPMQVILLIGIDQADAVVTTAIKKAIMTGRIVDSFNQEFGSLENTIFVLIVDSKQPEEIKTLGWHLELSVGPNIRKRLAEHEQYEERRNKPRTIRHPPCLDLNLCTGSSSSIHNDDEEEEEEKDDGDDSDLTEENGHNIGKFREPLPVPPSISDIYHLLDQDQVIDFRPFDLGHFKLTISKIMSEKFSSVMGETLHLGVELRVLDHMADTILHGDGGIRSFEQWSDKVLIPVVEQLKSKACLKDGDKVHLSFVEDRQPNCMTSCHGTQLPVSVIMALDAT
jgi:hypothetical protein